MKPFLSILVGASLFSLSLFAAGSEEGFVSLMDGKTFEGWKASIDNTNTWQIEDGAFVTRGKTAHLFYAGDLAPFKDFDLKVEVMTETNSNGGIYFHTEYQEKGFPKAGFECQVNNSHTDWIRTGSLYGLVNIGLTHVQDYKWYTQEIIVRGSKVTVKLDGKTVLEYNEPAGVKMGTQYGRKLSSGTFALQAHDPKSVIRYKNIRVKKL